MSQKIKLLTWNTGLATWYKPRGIFRFTLNGKKVEHEYFQAQYTDFVCDFLKKQDADVCVLQEFHDLKDVELVISKMRNVYPYYATVNTWYHKHSILVLSKDEISKEKFGATEFSVLKTKDFSFIPIHLHSFSAKVRLKQVRSILSEDIASIGCILGDTNFYAFNKNRTFLFKSDKEAYGEILEKFKDTGKDSSPTTRFNVYFDKIFLKKVMGFKNFASLREAKRGMDHFPILVELDI